MPPKTQKEKALEAKVVREALAWYSSNSHRNMQRKDVDLWNAVWTLAKTKEARDAP
jgi:hypothetical protein